MENTKNINPQQDDSALTAIQEHCSEPSFDSMIGGPLMAVVQAQERLSRQIDNFIAKVGLETQQELPTSFCGIKILIKKVSRKEVWDHISAASAQVYDKREASAVCKLIYRDIFDSDQVSLILHPEDEIADEQTLNEVVYKIQSKMPVQYIIGHTLFCDLNFKVTPHVLIPRPETEELVRWITQTHSMLQGAHVLDIGTGSGAIAISLGKMLNQAILTAIDISNDALNIAKHNADINRVAVEFSTCDILTQTPVNKYDIVVSNPPYVTTCEKRLMVPNVLDYEPHLALFVADDDPLIFYRIIAQKCLSMLREGGVLYFEINESYSNQIVDMLNELNYTNIELRDDIFNKPRMVRAWLS